MNIIFLIALGIISSVILTQIYIKISRKFGLFDIPNARSLHTHPIPTSGGVVPILTALGIWTLTIHKFDQVHVYLLCTTLIVLAISFWDDVKPQSPILRLAVQLTMIVLMVAQIEPAQNILPIALPLWLDRIIVIVSWLWFVNLFNFMDGIDGLVPSGAIAIFIGIFLVGNIVDYNLDLKFLSCILSATIAGFLFWNWSHAKVLLGDSGSVTLGFVIGWLLIQLSLAGQFLSAIILPLYFVADATLTLCRRAFSGEKFWQPHKTHFYQRSVAAGHSHSKIVWLAALTKMVLVLAALLAVNYPISGIMLAIFSVAALMLGLKKLSYLD